MSELEQFVVYKNPRDCPGKWVVRRWSITSGAATPCEARVFDSLEQARFAIPPQLICLARAPDDDPAVYEVWT